MTKEPGYQIWLSASLSAILGGSITHPIDVLKVRLQINKREPEIVTFVGRRGQMQAKMTGQRSLFSTAYSIATAEGFGAFYKGLSASMVRQVLMYGTGFATYNTLRRKMEVSNAGQKVTFAQKVLCGLSSGVFSSMCGNPADMVMVRMQADGKLPVHCRRRYKHIGDGLMRVVREEGVLMLWRGCTPSMARSMIIRAAQLAVYDEAKSVGRTVFALQEGLPLHLTAAMVSSFAASLCSNPLDVAKTRLQWGGPRALKPYSGLSDCMRTMVRKEGFSSLYTGLAANLARQLPLNVVRFVAYEEFMRMFALR